MRSSWFAVICGGLRLKRRVEGTQMTWGFNFASNNDTNAVNMAQSIFRAFSATSETTRNGVVLGLIELGMYVVKAI